MKLPLKLLEWDSEHFGVRIGRVETTTPGDFPQSDLDRWVTGHQIDCVYLLVEESPDHTRWAEQGGFSFVGGKLDFEISSSSTPPSEAVRAGRERDVETFDDVLRRDYTDSRFFFDGHFPRDAIESLYCGWMQRSLDGAFDDEVLVVERGGDAAGFVTLRREAQNARIGLIGVSADSRRQGVATELVEAARCWAGAQGFDTLRVATQGSNLSAARLYERAGGVLASHQLWFHRWTAR